MATAPRDSQRSKVYALGRRYEKQDTLSLEECEALIIWAHHQYGLEWRGKVVTGRGGNSALYKHHSRQISLPLWARNSHTTLHEASHAIVHHLQPVGAPWAPHGAEFVRILAELLARADVAPLPEYRRAARAARVKVSSAMACQPLPVTLINQRAAVRDRIRSLRAQLAESEAELNALGWQPERRELWLRS